MTAPLRRQLLQLLKPLVPSTWTVLDYWTDLGDTQRTTLMFQPITLGRAAEAPLGLRDVTFQLAIIHPSQDDQKAPAALDDQLLQLTYALDQLAIRWDPFQFGADASERWGWTTNLTITTEKEPE